ncbi:MAG TPA: GNAT family N-acetyltransferase [Myxococcota bacterium]
MTLHIRDAVFADLDVLVDNNVTMAMESEALALDPATVRRGIERLLNDPQRGRYVVAVDDDAGDDVVIGQLMLTLEWSDWRDGWWWWIQSVYVAAAHRRRGIYRALHERIVAELEHHPDVCGLRLYVEPENTTARAVYTQLGMHESYRVMELPRPR